MSARALQIALPLVVLAVVVLAWHAAVRVFVIPPYVLPGPGVVAKTRPGRGVITTMRCDR